MDTFATRYWIEDRDGRLSYSISVSPLDGQRYYNHTAVDAQESNLDVEDQIILGRSQDPDIILRWEVQISGKLYPGLQQDLGSRLQDKRVPLAIRDWVVSIIADQVLRWPTPTGVSVGIHALIEAAEAPAPALEKVTIKGGERETGCAVCLEDFSLGIDAAKLPCSHVFHGDCLGRWLQIRRVCPLCSYDLSNVVD